jgi:hypothetical protein
VDPDIDAEAALGRFGRVRLGARGLPADVATPNPALPGSMPHNLWLTCENHRAITEIADALGRITGTRESVAVMLRAGIPVEGDRQAPAAGYAVDWP